MIIENALKEYPYEFKHLRNSFELIVKIQHYGGATRFLDFSISPYIALFFACDNMSVDGKVIMYRSTSENQDFIGARVLSIFATYDCLKGNIYDYIRRELNINYSDEYILNSIRQSYFILPELSNERMFRQKGVFLIFGQNNILSDKFLIRKTESSLSDISGRGERYSGAFISIKIPAKSKNKIKYELLNKGISEDYLFPSLDKGLKKINEINYSE